jgi:hypothetical protein
VTRADWVGLRDGTRYRRARAPSSRHCVLCRVEPECPAGHGPCSMSTCALARPARARSGATSMSMCPPNGLCSSEVVASTSHARLTHTIELGFEGLAASPSALRIGATIPALAAAGSPPLPSRRAAPCAGRRRQAPFALEPRISASYCPKQSAGARERGLLASARRQHPGTRGHHP